jgi:conjugal transfer/entry exclusion protein
VDTKAQKEKELLAQQLKEKDALHLSLVNQSQQQIQTLKQLQDELSGSKQMVTNLKESITALESSLAESEAQRKKSEADVLILLEETDALQKKQNGSIEESVKIEEVIREAKANIFKEKNSIFGEKLILKKFDVSNAKEVETFF